MRPAGKGPLDSLYFNYPNFPARRVPELDGIAARHPVVIVGAGPIGMTAALVLARYGIRSVLHRPQGHVQRRQPRHLHRAAEHAYPGADRRGRAVPRQRRSAGASAAATTAASRSSGSRCRIRRSEKYLPMYNLQQQYIEQYPARRGRGLRPRSTCAGRASSTGIECAQRRCCRSTSPRRPATIASTPTMCSPPTARARRSARCWACG